MYIYKLQVGNGIIEMKKMLHLISGGSFMNTIKRIIRAGLFILFFIMTGCAKKVPIQYVCSDGWLILKGEMPFIECTVIKDGIEHKYFSNSGISQYQNDQLNIEWCKWVDDYNKYLYILKLRPLFLASTDFKIKIKYYYGSKIGGKYIKTEYDKMGRQVQYYTKNKTKKLTQKVTIHVLKRDEYLQNKDARKYFQKLENDAINFNQKNYKTKKEFSEGIRKEFIALAQLGLLRYSDEDLNKIAIFLDKEISQKINRKEYSISISERNRDLNVSKIIADKVKFLLLVLQTAKNPLALDILSSSLDKLENYPYGDENGVDGRSILLSLPEVKDKNGPNVDVHEEVRRSIISTLGKMGDAALPILLNIEPRSGFADVDNELYSPWKPGQRNQYIRWDGIKLANALGTIGNPSAYTYLVKLYNASSAETKDAIIMAMGRINNPKAIPFLYKLYLKGGLNEIYILRSLGETRDIKAIDYLVKIDKKFLQRYSQDPNRKFVVEALLIICHSNKDALPLIFDLYNSDKSLFLELFKKIDDKRIDDFLASRK